MKEKYPEFYDHIKNLSGKLARDLRGPMAAFAQLTGATTQPAALDTKTKRLIALGIGIAARCRGCIAIHMHDALQAGATREEILETMGICILMGGGPGMVYACEALEVLDQFESAGHKPTREFEK